LNTGRPGFESGSSAKDPVQRRLDLAAVEGVAAFRFRVVGAAQSGDSSGFVLHDLPAGHQIASAAGPLFRGIADKTSLTGSACQACAAATVDAILEATIQVLLINPLRS